MSNHLDPLIGYVLEKQPHTRGNNTEICLAVWEEVATRKGINLNNWLEMKAIIRTYKPESVTRARRDLVPPTDRQLTEEEKMRDAHRS